VQNLSSGSLREGNDTPFAFALRIGGRLSWKKHSCSSISADANAGRGGGQGGRNHVLRHRVHEIAKGITSWHGFKCSAVDLPGFAPQQERVTFSLEYTNGFCGETPMPLLLLLLGGSLRGKRIEQKGQLRGLLERSEGLFDL
jgi:hypothetical protein